MAAAQFLEIQGKPRYFRPDITKSKTPVSVRSEGLLFAGPAVIPSLKI